MITKSKVFLYISRMQTCFTFFSIHTQGCCSVLFCSQSFVFGIATALSTKKHQNAFYSKKPKLLYFCVNHKTFQTCSWSNLLEITAFGRQAAGQTFHHYHCPLQFSQYLFYIFYSLIQICTSHFISLLTFPVFLFTDVHAFSCTYFLDTECDLRSCFRETKTAAAAE